MPVNRVFKLQPAKRGYLKLYDERSHELIDTFDTMFDLCVFAMFYQWDYGRVEGFCPISQFAFDGVYHIPDIWAAVNLTRYTDRKIVRLFV